MMKKLLLFSILAAMCVPATMAQTLFSCTFPPGSDCGAIYEDDGFGSYWQASEGPGWACLDPGMYHTYDPSHTDVDYVAFGPFTMPVTESMMLSFDLSISSFNDELTVFYICDTYSDPNVYPDDWTDLSGPITEESDCAPQAFPLTNLLSECSNQFWIAFRYQGLNQWYIVIDNIEISYTIQPPTGCVADPLEICLNDSSEISASSVYDIHWFKNANNPYSQTPFSTESPFTDTPDESTTYYAWAWDGSFYSSDYCDVTVTVTDLPDVTCPANFTVCADAEPVTLEGAEPEGGEYGGDYVSEGVFDPSLAEPGDYPITYTYTDTGTGCTNSCTFTITVDPLPDVTCPDNFTVCADAEPVTLEGAEPEGGEYGGDYVSEGVFDPASAEPGDYPITYTYTDTGTGCTDSCTFTITVSPLPDCTISAPDEYIENTLGSASVLNAGTATYAWTVTGATITTGQGTDTVSFMVGAAGTPVTLSCTITDANNCSCASGDTVVPVIVAPPIPATGLAGIGLLLLAIGALMSLAGVRRRK